MNTNDTTSNKNRTVIYGGTFAPIHMGHVHAVRACREQLRPDRMLVMPANIPPHKQIDPADQPMRRYEMACLALEDEAGYGDSLTVSDYELSCDGKSYTVSIKVKSSDLLAAVDLLNFLSATNYYAEAIAGSIMSRSAVRHRHVPDAGYMVPCGRDLPTGAHRADPSGVGCKDPSRNCRAIAALYRAIRRGDRHTALRCDGAVVLRDPQNGGIGRLHPRTGSRKSGSIYP